MSLLKSLLAAVALSLAATGCAISFPDYPLGAGGSSSGSMSTGALMVTPCVPAACDPDALAADSAIDPMCGVFVSPGANGGDGTQGSPYGSLTAALMNDATQRPIYVCTTPTGLDEAVTLSGAIDVYGGFDCSSWKKSGMKTKWTADPNRVPLRITNSGFKECDGAFVDGFAITARNASGADATTHNGNSSIGAFVSGGFATLVNVDIVAGNGADGTAGAKNPMAVGNSANGQSGSACAAGAGPTGAVPAPQMCNGSDVSGGHGGDGGMTSGAKGGDGSGAANLPGTGFGVGSGGLTSPSSSCAEFEDGADGLDGTVVGGGTSLGKLDANGFQGAGGERGKDGAPGGGGGGGGGLAGNGLNGCGPGVDGSGGGGGGAGGCGGLGGDGGGAGGASIALASFGANVALKNVTLKAQQGGNGADGGDGQQGGAGGMAGQGGCFGAACACSGGHGGKGGSGTAGGGGKGGSSFGIAFHGDMAPSIPDTAIIVSLAKATGGMGGMSAIGLSGAGDPGDNVKIQAFP